MPARVQHTPFPATTPMADAAETIPHHRPRPKRQVVTHTCGSRKGEPRRVQVMCHHQRPTWSWLEAVGPESYDEHHWEARVLSSLTKGHRSSNENKHDDEAQQEKPFPKRTSLTCHSCQKNTEKINKINKIKQNKHFPLVLENLREQPLRSLSLSLEVSGASL